MKKTSGFTLIELTIVVAIVAILGVIAAGYFSDNVIASKRTEARSTLTEVAASLEKCRALYGRYNHGNCNVTFPVLSDTNLYSVVHNSTLAATTFTLTANPIPGQSQANDTDCTSLSLTNTGIKSSTGGGQCW